MANDCPANADGRKIQRLSPEKIIRRRSQRSLIKKVLHLPKCQSFPEAPGKLGPFFKGGISRRNIQRFPIYCVLYVWRSVLENG
ncbi:hypothetical protein CEXT_742131 [Caerostris extrusa]|uniref:Uncharacterized protein n=1 Tax=Caerostris extrusa TaxID=172846 RepID=A0AAV4SJC6_CAEEX|nr:hypothetical protein CEXT_742131 [Caerostris extrusa]